MNTVPDLTTATTTAATETGKAATTVRLRLSPEGCAIEHPDPELGQKLLAQALGAPDNDAMNGLLRQLVKASMTGRKTDPANLAFMMSMVESIKPRDSIEAMLVTQMVSVHVMAMKCVHRFANADDVALVDSASRALGKLTRTFPAQIDALNRHRNTGAPAITVQNVSVGDGGKAIVGNVTQHAGVIVADQAGTAAGTASLREELARQRAQQ